MDVTLFRVLKEAEKVGQAMLLLIADNLRPGSLSKSSCLVIGILDVAELINEFRRLGILATQDASVRDTVAQ